jgi:hypothetical protein
MRSAQNDPLLLAGTVLTLLAQGIMALAAVAIALTLVAALGFSDMINAELVAEYGPDIIAMPVGAVAALLLVVMGLCALVFLFFGKLRGIIATVAEGDPFVPENADRLNAMAWLQIGIYVASLLSTGAAAMVAKWAEQFAEVSVKASLDLDVPSLLLVVILFILARVFRQGAALRADLEGTV